MLRIVSCFFALSLCTQPASAATIFQFTSSPTSWIGYGQSRYVTPLDGYVFTATRNWDNGVSFDVRMGVDDEFQLELAAPGDSTLEVGLYTDATRWPFQSMIAPGLDFSGNSRGVNRLSGFFEVLEAVYDEDGTVLRFAVDFTQYDEENTARWNIGSIRFNSDIAVVPLPAALWMFMFALSSLVHIGSTKIRS